MPTSTYKNAGGSGGKVTHPTQPQAATMPSPMLDFIDNVIDKTVRVIMNVYWAGWVVRRGARRFVRRAMATGYGAVVAFYVCVILALNAFVTAPRFIAHFILRFVRALNAVRDVVDHVLLPFFLLTGDFRFTYDPRHAEMIAAVAGDPFHNDPGAL